MFADQLALSTGVTERDVLECVFAEGIDNVFSDTSLMHRPARKRVCNCFVHLERFFLSAGSRHSMSSANANDDA